MSRPAASVIVATHNRVGLLGRTLDGLARQVGPLPFEVIVVDDASTDGTWETLKRLPAELPFPLIPLRQSDNQGPAAARNAGWRAARADLICFTDDDCVPEPGWLAGLSAGLADADIAQGCTLPNPDQVSRWGTFSHTVEIKCEGGFYETCNIGYRRSWLETTGGFDETFPFPYGEDAELGWRAKGRGARTAFVPDAVVYHDVGDSDFGSHLRSIRRRTALVHFVRLHPEARTIFPGRWYHKRTHPPALLVVVAAVALAARPRRVRSWLTAGVSVGLYTRACLRTWKAPPRRRDWPGLLPFVLVADLVEIATLGVASVRERTLFL